MSSEKADLPQMLNDLVVTIHNRIKSGEADAATLNVARALLKDNGIQARAAKESPLGNLADSLPFTSAEDDADAPTIN